MPLKDEISFFDLNEEMSYYEVEIWKNGTLYNKFFRTIRSAKAYFNKNAKSENDCIKLHKYEGFMGQNTYLVYQF